MNNALDRYANLSSPIHNWDTRYKFISLMGLIFAFSFVQDLRLLPLLLILTFMVFIFSRLPFSFLISRLKYPGIFLLAIAVIFPLFSGNTILLSVGHLTIRLEGLITLILVSTKFFCILTIALVLFGSAPFLTTIKAMRALRLSPILSDIMLLTYRYIFDIGYDLYTMQVAMKLRHFRASKLSFRNTQSLSSLVGTLIVRSFEKSERIYKAMILRGYGYKATELTTSKSIFNSRSSDKLAMLAFSFLAFLIICAEIYLRMS